jgi:hypothetical protein
VYRTGAWLEVLRPRCSPIGPGREPREPDCNPARGDGKALHSAANRETVANPAHCRLTLPTTVPDCVRVAQVCNCPKRILIGPSRADRGLRAIRGLFGDEHMNLKLRRSL